MLQIIFRTAVQAALFNEELASQISDGHWENSRPNNHWRQISLAKGVVVPGAALGPAGFYPRRKYNFNDGLLVECVGDRLLGYARAVAGPDYSMKQLRKDLRDMSDIVNGKSRV